MKVTQVPAGGCCLLAIIKCQKDMIVRTRIINVERKPRRCPVCKGIIYGIGDVAEPKFLLEYRREGIMDGDIILYPKDMRI